MRGISAYLSSSQNEYRLLYRCEHVKDERRMKVYIGEASRISVCLVEA